MLLSALCVFSFASSAQTDSTDHNLLVKEVIVQGSATKSNGLEIKQNDNAQLLIDKLLEGVNGVTLIKRGNYAQEPIVRGLNPAQINTTIDGMHVFGACTGHMDPISSYVEPNNLKSIQLNLGPNNEQIGASIGGGFNFKLAKPTLNASRFISGSVGTGFETNSSAYRFLGALQLSKKRWAIRVNSIYRKAENYKAAGGREIQFSQYEKWNLGINSLFAINNYHFISADYLQDDGSNIGYPALRMDVSYANAKIGSLSHLYKRSGKTIYRWETKVYYNLIDHAMDDTKRPPETIAMHMDMPGTSNTMGFYSNASLRLGKKHFVKIKANAYLNDLHAEMTMYPNVGAEMFLLTIPDARRILAGIDFSDKILWTKKFKLSVGARYDYVRASIITNDGRKTLTSIYSKDLTKQRNLFNAFVQGEYQLSKKTSISGGVAKAMRAPTLQENYGFYLFNQLDNYDYIGNPDLKTEESWNVNVGGSYQTKKIVLNTKVFAYLFDNYIAGVKLDTYSAISNGAKGVKQYSNLSSAIITGFEVGLKAKLSKNLLFSTSNAFSYGEDMNHHALPRIPPLKSVNTLAYNIKGYQMQIKYTTAMAQNHINFEAYGERETREFNVFDASVGKTFIVKKYSYAFNVALNNIFDTPYYEHLDVLKINRQGRSLLMHFTFTF